MSIGPPRRSVQFAALALALALAACGSSRLKAGAPRVSVPPLHGRVPPEARVLTVSRGYPGRKPSLSFTTTNAGKVTSIATMLDRMRVVHAGIVNCPNIPVAPTVTFAFRAERHGPVLARARTLATGPRGECPGVTFKRLGSAPQSLSAQPAFLRSAGRVLGVTLLSK